MDPAPDALLRAAVPARSTGNRAPVSGPWFTLVAFALDSDAGALDPQVQRAARSPVGDVRLQVSTSSRTPPVPRSRLDLAPWQRAEVRHRPVKAHFKADLTQKSLDEPGRLSRRRDGLHLTPSDRHGAPHRGSPPGDRACRSVSLSRSWRDRTRSQAEARCFGASSQAGRFRVPQAGEADLLMPHGFCPGSTG